MYIYMCVTSISHIPSHAWSDNLILLVEERIWEAIRGQNRQGDVSPAGLFDFNQKLGSVNNRRTLASCSLATDLMEYYIRSPWLKLYPISRYVLPLISGTKLELQRFQDDLLPINFLIHALIPLERSLKALYEIIAV